MNPKILYLPSGGSGIFKENGEDKEGIQFNLSAIPLGGGYDRFLENYNATMDNNLEFAAQEKRDEIKGIIIEENREYGGTTTGGSLSFFNFKSEDDTIEEELLVVLKKLNLLLNMVVSASSASWFQNLCLQRTFHHN